MTKINIQDWDEMISLYMAIQNDQTSPIEVPSLIGRLIEISRAVFLKPDQAGFIWVGKIDDGLD